MKKLSALDVRKKCDPENLPDLAGVEPVKFLGQKRAEDALRMSFGIGDDAFNAFLIGSQEAGKTTLVTKILDEVAAEKPVPDDYCYVFNFIDEKKPRWLSFPAGEGKIFKKKIRGLIKRLLLSINVEAQIINKAQKKREKLVEELKAEMKPYNFTVLAFPVQEGTRYGVGYFLDDGRICPVEHIETNAAFPKRTEILAVFNEQGFKEKMDKLVEGLRAIDKKVRETLANEEGIKKLKKDIIVKVFAEAGEEYMGDKKVISYLKEMEEDVKENIGLFDFSAPLQQFQQGSCAGCAYSPDKCPIHGPEGFFSRYEVNLFIDRSELSGAPVVVKNAATYHDLFGRISMDFTPTGTGVRCDHNMISSGALHEANGGFLVLKINDTMIQPLFLATWGRLLSALKAHEIKIENISRITGFENGMGPTITPDPIPLDVRIVFVGSERHYYALLQADEFLEFTRIFKTKAQMERDMPRNSKNELAYLGFIKRYCEKENLLLPDKTALARLIEFGSEKADSQSKLTLDLSVIKTLLKEVDYYARKDGQSEMTVEDIDYALEQKRLRHCLMDEKYQDLMTRGIFVIDVDGEKVGQINGLAVLNCLDYCFGKPSRITAVISAGREGVTIVDKIAKMTGSIHDKGEGILSNYFYSVFGQDFPLAFRASLSFEQNYGGVDGDSASSTELYCLLSAFSGVPIKQGIAVTGSVDQNGNVQAIGGANEKIKGFFEICKAKGLTGKQGVMIPETNMDNLMLDKEIAQAIDEGKFHIWAVNRIEEGIEILTGTPFGGENCSDESCIFKRVKKCLSEMSKKVKDAPDKKVSSVNEQPAGSCGGCPGCGE